METMSVLLFVLGVIAGLALGYLTAVARGARARAEQQAALAAASARAALLEQTVADLRARTDADVEVLQTLAPVKESLARVGAQVAQLERDRVDQYAALKEQMTASQERTDALQKATVGLEAALRSTSARGHWGEVELRRILEAAGMLRHVDFLEQRALENGGGRPDVVVQLPGGRLIPIDAKVPMDAHLEAEALDAVDAASSARIKELRGAHAKALRAHVDALAKRDYHGVAGADSTVMFLPAESLLSAALDADPALLDYALGKGVVPASPATLLALLRAVANIWVREEMSEQAEDLLRIGRTLYERLGVVAEHMNALGGQIGKVVGAYNKAAASFETRLLVTAREFEPLGGPAQVLPVSPDAAQVRQFTAAELAG